MLGYYEYSILIGILAWVHVWILCEEDMVFGVIWKLRLPTWLSKILRSCEYCVAGQLSLWGYLYLYWNDYNFVNHILFIGLSIYTTEVLDGIKNNFFREG